MQKNIKLLIISNSLFIIAESVRFLLYAASNPSEYTLKVIIAISFIIALQLSGLLIFSIAIYRFFVPNSKIQIARESE